MRLTLAGLLALFVAAEAQAQSDQWRPAGSHVAGPAAPTGPGEWTGPVRLGAPVALGAPVPCAPPPCSPSVPSAPIIPAAYHASVLGPPQATVRAQSPDVSGPSLVPPPGSPPPPPPPPPPTNEPYNCGVVAGPPAPAKHPFLGRVREWFGMSRDGTAAPRTPFQSDHGFDEVGLISPVSNPFLFEDPRSLTEVRPIFMWQQTPSSNLPFHGGDVEYAGIQARLAFTDRLSVVMTKLGYVWMEPHDHSLPDFQDATGFAELWLGPKYTFYRCEQTGTVAAAGLNFQIPIGSSRVIQDTGDLTLEPYISFAQNFGRSQYGSFNFMNTTGYAVDIGDKRSDYIFSSFHLDYDVARLHKIYPLVELNYFYFTDSGSQRPFNFEGRDLFNFGSEAVQTQSNLTLALGARYKFCEAIQAGLVGEFPLTGQHDLLDFRLTADLIFRY